MTDTKSNSGNLESFIATVGGLVKRAGDHIRQAREPENLLTVCESFLETVEEASESGRLTDWEILQLTLLGRYLDTLIATYEYPQDWAVAFPNTNGPVTEGERMTDSINAVVRSIDTRETIDDRDLKGLRSAISRLRSGIITSSDQKAVKEKTRPKRKRATKKETELKVYGAVMYRINHPFATEKRCAEAGGIKQSTLHDHPVWKDWCLRIKEAAMDGTTSILKRIVDAKIGDTFAVDD